VLNEELGEGEVVHTRPLHTTSLPARDLHDEDERTALIVL
jgi:hypothetical protein